MLELTAEEFDDVDSQVRQVYRPNGVDLARRNRLEQYRHKEFESGDVAELFHENTKIDPVSRHLTELTGAQLDSVGFEYTQARSGRHDYDSRPLVELPEPPTLDRAVDDVILGRRSRREYASRSLTRRELSGLLRYGVGVSGSSQGEITDDQSLERSFRTHPSPGSMNPVELFVCAIDVDGLEDGVYFYSPTEHGLRELDTGHEDVVATVDGVIASDRGLSTDTAGLYLLFGATFWRAKAKYGPRGYRYVLQESGHMAQNLLLAAEALDLGGVPLAAFDDRAANDLLGLDGVNRATIYSMLVGPTDE